jgi:hypothetical protein
MTKLLATAAALACFAGPAFADECQDADAYRADLKSLLATGDMNNPVVINTIQGHAKTITQLDAVCAAKQDSIDAARQRALDAAKTVMRSDPKPLRERPAVEQAPQPQPAPKVELAPEGEPSQARRQAVAEMVKQQADALAASRQQANDIAVARHKADVVEITRPAPAPPQITPPASSEAAQAALAQTLRNPQPIIPGKVYPDDGTPPPPHTRDCYAPPYSSTKEKYLALVNDVKKTNEPALLEGVNKLLRGSCESLAEQESDPAFRRKMGFTLEDSLRIDVVDSSRSMFIDEAMQEIAKHPTPPDPRELVASFPAYLPTTPGEHQAVAEGECVLLVEKKVPYWATDLIHMRMFGDACKERYNYKTHDECMADVTARMARDDTHYATKNDVTAEDMCRDVKPAVAHTPAGFSAGFETSSPYTVVCEAQGTLQHITLHINPATKTVDWFSPDTQLTTATLNMVEGIFIKMSAVTPFGNPTIINKAAMVKFLSTKGNIRTLANNSPYAAIQLIEARPNGEGLTFAATCIEVN